MIEYLRAGATAVAAGTVHLAEPKAGTRILRELSREMDRLGVEGPGELVGSVTPW
jgi:dihydroorotate dehydrogenase